ncbi:MAG: LLM class flavin-dependent oxidoreductase [Trebonia sp.]
MCARPRRRGHWDERGVSAAEADVQLFWGEPLDDVAGRIERLRALSRWLGREHAPLEFGLRITTLARDTSEEAWRDAEDRVARMAEREGQPLSRRWRGAVGQRRLLALQERGEVLDSCLYTTPGKFGGGGAGTTWLVGSHDEVAAALRKYAGLGIDPIHPLVFAFYVVIATYFANTTGGTSVRSGRVPLR